MSEQFMKLICNKTVNGVTSVRNITTPAGNQGAYVATIVGAGNPFWMWDTIPSGTIIGADFTGAPIATSDATTNNGLINGITELPENVLIYA